MSDESALGVGNMPQWRGLNQSEDLLRRPVVRRLGLTLCYPKDCYDKTSECSLQEICIRYVSIDAPLKEALERDGALTAANVADRISRTVGLSLGLAALGGIVVGLFSLCCIIVSEGKCSTKFRQIARCRQRNAKIIITIFVVIILSVIILCAVLSIRDAEAVVEEMSGGVLNSALQQILFSFFEYVSSLKNAGVKGQQWSLLLRNPTESKLEVDLFSGYITIQKLNLARFELQASAAIDAKKEGVLPLRIFPEYITGSVGTIKALVSEKLGNLLYVGIDLTTEGSCEDSWFSFKSLFELPLDSKTLPPLTQLVAGEVNLDELKQAVIAGLGVYERTGNTIMQTDSIQVRGGKADRAFALFVGMLLAIGIAALCFSMVCFSTLALDTCRNSANRSRSVCLPDLRIRRNNSANLGFIEYKSPGRVVGAGSPYYINAPLPQAMGHGHGPPSNVHVQNVHPPPPCGKAPYLNAIAMPTHPTAVLVNQHRPVYLPAAQQAPLPSTMTHPSRPEVWPAALRISSRQPPPPGRTQMEKSSHQVPPDRE